MEKFHNKYRIPSARAAWWNYGWNGAYFITICTENRHHYFGEILDGVVQLSPQGILADLLWHQIPYHARHVELGAFVVMPNHLHGILILNNLGVNEEWVGAEGDSVETGDNVETGHALSLPRPQTRPILQPPPIPSPDLSPAQSRFQNQGKNTISSIVGGYKSAVTKNANRLGFEFGWQARFHDHIIRTDADYQRINDYIETNPQNWEGDKFYTA